MHYSSHGVREQTAAIASWALSDAGSVRSDSSPRRRHTSAEATDEDLSIAGVSEQDEAAPRESLESTRPGPIEEVSEPVSPNSSQSSRQLPRASVLAQLIRDSPPQGIERISPEGADDEVSESPPTTTMTVTNVDTTSSNEQSTLLHKDTPNTTHHYGTTSDLEGQAQGREVSYPGIVHLLHWPRSAARHALSTVTSPKSWTLNGLWEHGCVRPARYVPAVILGLLLNILDALSYGQ